MTAIREAIKCDLPVVVVATPPKQPKGRRFFGRKKRTEPEKKPQQAASKAQTVQPVLRTGQEEFQFHPRLDSASQRATSPGETRSISQTTIDPVLRHTPSQQQIQATAQGPHRVRRAVLTRSVRNPFTYLDLVSLLWDRHLHLVFES